MDGETAFERAVRVGREAAEVGFDWAEAREALEKVGEETAELNQELDAPERAFEELGDLLFAVANVARKLDLDGEAALRAATDKFERRFSTVLALIAKHGKTPEQLTLPELEAFWQLAKRQ